MPHKSMQTCIDACNGCAATCGHCASACLQEEAHGNSLARCIALDIDCAEVCRIAAAFMSRGSEFCVAICGLCAEVCDACAEECERHDIHDMDHCKECAAACRKCADECRRTANAAGGVTIGKGASGASMHQ
jgi:hypothetical protein